MVGQKKETGHHDKKHEKHGHGDKKHQNKTHDKKHEEKHGQGKKHQDEPTQSVKSKKQGEKKKENPNLTKRDLKMIEKLHAKIEFHEIRDEYEDADKCREQIVAIEENSNLKAVKKAEKKAAAEIQAM